MALAVPSEAPPQSRGIGGPLEMVASLRSYTMLLAKGAKYQGAANSVLGSASLYRTFAVMIVSVARPRSPVLCNWARKQDCID